MNELAIHFPNLKTLLQMDEALRFVDVLSSPSTLLTALFAQNPNIYDYAVNLASLQTIQKVTDTGLDFSRLYFGQETCQNLIPGPDDLEQAFYIACQMEWDFTCVTNAANTEDGIEKNHRLLETLHRLAPEAEVVVNDWGVMHLIRKHFPSFRPVIGRLLNKQTRLNIFKTEKDFPVLTNGIETPEETIRTAQLQAYADVSLSNPDYLETLHDLGVTGTDFDMTPQGILRPEDGWNLRMGLYYPWAIISIARNCPTAGLHQKQRTFVMTDKPCGKPCRTMNCSPDFIMYDLPAVMRGNALFVSVEGLVLGYLNRQETFERLIYQPYLPL